MKLRTMAVMTIMGVGVSIAAASGQTRPSHPPRQAPQVWLSGIDPVIAAMTHQAGAPDWMNLFASGSPWPQAGRRVDVFFVGTRFFDHATDEQLGTVIGGLKARDIALGMAALMLVPTQRCGIGIGSYGRAGVMDRVAQRVTALGGRLDYVRLDSPVWFAHHEAGPRHCQNSLAAIAQQMAEPARALRTAFPRVSFVDAEPMNNHTDAAFLTEVLQFATEFQKATGYKIDTIHADPIWRDNWRDQFRSWQARTRAAGLRFGVICRGSAPDRTDREWTREAVQVIAQARSAGSGEPDDIVLQTYNPHPARMLPESDPAAMTWIVRQAFPP